MQIKGSYGAEEADLKFRQLNMAITRVSLYMHTLKNLDHRKGKWKFLKCRRGHRTNCSGGIEVKYIDFSKL